MHTSYALTCFSTQEIVGIQYNIFRRCLIQVASLLGNSCNFSEIRHVLQVTLKAE